MHRLILFDVDGTLLSTDGAAGRAFHTALLEVYGTAGPIATFSFHGRTDQEIARTLLREAGLEDDAIDHGFADLWTAYLHELAATLARPGHQARVLPGVEELLDALEARPDEVVMGLLTGNILEGARLKLASCGLEHRFALGAYGSDHEQRDRLPAIAVERAQGVTGHQFAGRNVVIVGDTPFDVACGRPIGARTVAVATGRHTENELRAAGADTALADLADIDAALAALLAA